jgi:hypothetical protein
METDIQSQRAGENFARYLRSKTSTFLILLGFLFALAPAGAHAKPKLAGLDILPTITGITLSNGQLFASGIATAVLNGETNTIPFAGVPVNIALDTNQTGAGACPILDLMLGPIQLDLLGLLVETSPICVKITAYDGGGLLGDLLCSVATLLNTGTFEQLTIGQLTTLLPGVQNVLNGALSNLLQAVLTSVGPGTNGACSILHLELGPLNLNLLGLQVVLDNCANGPVVVDISAEKGGRNNVLGKLLCGLLGHGGINLGTTLQDLLNQLLNRQLAGLNVLPTITSLVFSNGQLLASGIATVVLNGQTNINGQTNNVPFSGVPVTIGLDTNPPVAGACPVLDLTLGPITLNLLGLVVETSPICLQVTAHAGGGLLGDLLCSVGNLLNGGLTLNQILSGLGLVNPVTGATLIPGLTPAQLAALLPAIQNLLNGALANLLQAVLTSVEQGTGGACSILHLELGPLDLTLLGLQVELDNCANGPVVVDITGQRGGNNNVLGKLLCGLLGGQGINPGATLQDLLNDILDKANKVKVK